jgi:xylan 1,4-beta-xylosidase
LQKNPYHAYLALREDFRIQLKEVQKEIRFKYIRFHNIFSEGVGIYNEDMKGEPYNNLLALKKSIQTV